MARPKSEEKRQAILDAAIEVIAEFGLGAAPTSAISKLAGVSEGTLFNYFPSKNELINSLYRSIKQEVALFLLDKFDRKIAIKLALFHIWDRYVTWGIAYPKKVKVLGQLRQSELLTEDSQRAGMEPFMILEELVMQNIRERKICQLPTHFIAASMGALAENAMMLHLVHGADGNDYSKLGFECFWKGITYE